MEASAKSVNPFLKYRGIQLNGRFIDHKDLNEVEGKNSFEAEVISYCRQLFDHSATTSIQSSGSTGTPKNLKFRKSALIQSAAATNKFFGLDTESEALLALPLAYVAAKLMVVRAIIGKYNLVTAPPSSNPLKNVTKPISFVPMTPHQVNSVLSETPESFEKVETVLLGGGEISEELQTQLQKLSTTFNAGFGMAETLTHFALSKIEGENELTYSVLSDVSIYRDERGCLVVNREGITEGNLVTNDLIELTENGFKWLGRIDNLINSGGVKVIPEVVEKQLKRQVHSSFFVAGIPDLVLGQKVALFIEGEETIDLKKKAFSLPYHRPKQIIFLPSFLYTESGKIKRRETVKRWLDSNGG